MTMIERVARAIAEARGAIGRDWHTIEDQHSVARAAIEAMREPTKEMIVAGGNAQTVNARANRGLYYRAMIDAALAEEAQ